jgi:hypothetical protein
MRSMESLESTGFARRSFLRLAFLAAASLVVGCQVTGLGSSTPDPDTAEPSGGAAEPTGDVTPSSAPSERNNETRKVLIAYFSRAGENYFNGGRTFLEVGNTEVRARMIGERVPCDVYRIEAVDPDPETYDETVTRNVAEQEADVDAARQADAVLRQNHVMTHLANWPSR